MYLHGDFPEDYEMWLRWMDGNVKVGKVDEVLLDWYDSDTRISRNHSIYSDKSFYKIKTYYLAKWLKKYNPFPLKPYRPNYRQMPLYFLVGKLASLDPR